MYKKADVIAKFEARYAFYAAQYKARPISEGFFSPACSIAETNMSNAWKDLQFIKRGTNWRLALPHTGTHPYTAMFAQDWAVKQEA